MIDKTCSDVYLTLGIHLGTSNSCSAIMLDNEPIVIPNEFGLLNTPSYVSFLEPNKRLVGQLSKLNILSNKNTVFCSKRLIGKNFSEKLRYEIEKKFPFKIIEEKETKKIKIEIIFKKIKNDFNQNTKETKNIEKIEEKKYFYPEQISAIILRKIKEDAERFLLKKINKKIIIKKAVIAVPANFNQNQRKATKQAAEIANLEVIGMINEPTAASLAYGLYKPDKNDENEVNFRKKIIVLDFGGGTLDFTLLTLTKNNNGIFCDINGSFGYPNFGGEDFDISLMEEILKKNSISNINEYDKLRLKLACEKAKIELSYNNSTKIILEQFALYTPINEINEIITQEEFLKICEPQFKKFKENLNEFIKVCEITKKLALIKDVILIGGSTKIIKIRNIIKEKFPFSEIKYSIDPSISVAKGAAIRALMLIEPKKYDNINLIDVSNFNIGTNVFKKEKGKEIMDIIIKRCSNLPAHGEKIYKTKENNQTSIINDIYEGYKEDLEENAFLGTFKISNLPERPKGKVKIKLSFHINTNSLLEAKAKELSNEMNEKKIQIKLEEPKGFPQDILKNLINEENNSQIINFPYYDKIRDKVIEKQILLDSLKNKEKELYLDILNCLFSLVSPEIQNELEKINSQIYLSYIKYIFSFAKLFFKNDEISLEYEDLETLKKKFLEVILFI